MIKLPFIPIAQHNESPLSLLRRSAIGNGYTSLLALLHSLHPSIDHSTGMLGFVARNPVLYQQLCQQLGINEKCAQKTIYRRTGNAREDSVLWLGLEIKIGDLTFNSEKVCIPCLLEKGYARSEWNHFSVNTCPEHNVYLDQYCPVCNRPYSYDQSPFDCGCTHTAIREKLRSVATNFESDIHNAISNKNQALLHFISNLRQLFNWWGQLGISQTQEQSAAFLLSFINKQWPERAPLLLPKLHPRVLLLSLLTAEDGYTQTITEKLLNEEFNTNTISKLNKNLSVTRYQAQQLLNISRSRFNHFIKEQLINTSDSGEFLLSDLNYLLQESSWLPFTNSKATQWNKARRIGACSLASQIKAELTNQLPKPQSNLLNCLSVDDVAKQLNANSESIRFLIKNNWFQAHKGTAKSAVQWVIDENSLTAFKKKYIFASAIAKQVNLPVTTTSSRLRFHGVSPVSGPGIDGGKTFLFSRKAIQAFDISLLNGSYKSPAGRKPKTNKSNDSTTISSTQLAKLLGISVHEIRFIVKNNWIDAPKNSQGHYCFFKSDTDSLLETVNNGFIDIETARELTEQTLQSFRRTWIISGFISARKLGKRWLITRDDFQKILEIWKENRTSSNIASSLGRQRHLCINLEKVGLITPTLIIGVKARKIKLYPKIHQCYENLNKHIHP